MRIYWSKGCGKGSPGKGVWTWSDGLSFHTLGVKFILVQEVLDPFQRDTGLQEGASQPWELCFFYPTPSYTWLAPNFLGEAGPPEGPDRVQVGRWRLSPERKRPLTLITSFNFEQFFIRPDGPLLIPVTP